MRTRPEVSEETIRQSDAALIFVKLRRMIASDTQSTDTILGTIAVAAHSLTGATGAAIAMLSTDIPVSVGESVVRDQFVFADLNPATLAANPLSQ